MPGLITSILQAIAAGLRARRRAANLRAGSADKGAKADVAAQRRLRSIQAGVSAAQVPGVSGRDGEAAVGRAGTHAGGAAAGELLRGRLPRLIGYAGAAATLAGGLLIAGHALHLGQATASTAQALEAVHAASAWHALLPGVAFTVPARAGVSASVNTGGALLFASGMQAAPAVRVDLCSQLRQPGAATLLPLRLGYSFDDVRRLEAQNRGTDHAVVLRNVLLVGAAEEGGTVMPEVQISGPARADFADPLSEPLQLSWRSKQGKARWLSDASFGQIEQGASGRVALRQQGWLIWGADGGQALRIERRSNAMCAQAGELLLQLYRLPAQAQTAGTRAWVTAFPARGKAVGAWLAPGQYQVPAAAPAALEDQTLFQVLQAKGLVRLGRDGAIELAPRDLPQWRAAGAGDRAAALEWDAASIDDGSRQLFKRLYYQADGAYVRDQIALFNSERRLLAWRVPQSGAIPAKMSGDIAATQNADLQWQASFASPDGAGADSGAVPLPASSQMPPSAVRLFARLPQGWAPWSRLAHWPQRQAPPGLTLTLMLPVPAQGGETLQLLLAGRALRASGAQLRISAACSGRACTRPDDVQRLSLELQPGARSVALDVQPLAIDAPEERQYRHLRVTAGQLAWHALPPASLAGRGAKGYGDGTGTAARAAGAAPGGARTTAVQLRDRHGSLLWTDGEAVPAAQRAGLGTMLGVSAEHGSSVAGMLARLPAASGAPVKASLTLDLPLQTLSRRVLDCVAMRRGRWDGASCSGGLAVPAERRAGLLILDTENGDILAAAGAGTGVVSGANWREVRDFDRSNPARSPLRLPALQHDGGAHQSPGSTFKVVSALGLEMAARRDPWIDSLLAGMPLAAINRLAHERGFAFQTGAASYPVNAGNAAHITNYREQGLDRRAQEGRLGLAQALSYSLNTWFAWSGELSDASLFGRADGGAPDLQALDPGALDALRPIVAAAHTLGFEQATRLDGGLLPADFNWSIWDALQATPAHIDPIHTRHELRQMSIGLRMQVTPLQMALAAGAIGQGRVIAPRLLLALDGRGAVAAAKAPGLGVRLDRIRAGMKGVVDFGTGAGAFSGAALAPLRAGLYGKTGTAPTGPDSATVWFTGWLEPGSLPGQTHRLAFAVFASHSEASGGEHAAPVIAALLATLARQSAEQKGK
ncbi:hypothetical protein HSX11_06005 [Oxalobacteraceae bacterium]|nr:hypothetical protein [Oxalobacteraceae bacterium]